MCAFCCCCCFYSTSSVLGVPIYLWLNYNHICVASTTIKWIHHLLLLLVWCSIRKFIPMIIYICTLPLKYLTSKWYPHQTPFSITKSYHLTIHIHIFSFNDIFASVKLFCARFAAQFSKQPIVYSEQVDVHFVTNPIIHFTKVINENICSAHFKNRLKWLYVLYVARCTETQVHRHTGKHGYDNNIVLRFL